MAIEPLTEPLVVSDPAPDALPAEQARSRRSVLGAGMAGLAGLMLGSLGRPPRADAAAGDSLVMGSANGAGTSDTSLTTDSSGTALLVTQTGGGTALRGSATALNGIAGFFTSANGPGVSGVTANNTKYGVYGGNDAATYNGGAAIRAAGEQNHGLVASTASTSAIAVKATNSAIGINPGQGPAVQGLASGGTAADLRPVSFLRAAGEFAGPNGLIGAASSDTTNGAGVVGVGNGTSAAGVVGHAMGTGGTGVIGRAESSTGATFGVEGVTSSPSGIGVKGINSATSGLAYGVWGSTASSATYASGVYGYASANSGFTYGVCGQADSTAGTGVAGITGGASGWGVYGFATNATGSSIGVEGESAAQNGAGVKGLASATSGFNSGVIGEADSTSGTGVYGTAMATSGTTYGVQGWNSSTAGTGVYGVAAATSGSTVGVEGSTASPSGIGVKGVNSATSGFAYGVYGTTASADHNATGVYGYATAASGSINGVWGQTDSNGGWGVYGEATSLTGTPVAVGGNAPSNGWALYGGGNAAVTGNLSVTGNVSKGGGSFKIDHPLDPANKFLYHSFVESPDMKNVYDGVVTLDHGGEATVTLPDWFEALNRDFRYQLTSIGSFSPLYVKRELAGNAFSIAGGAPGQKVSWQLTGIRKDAWADAHRIPVEEEKATADRGLYLHPTEHGLAAAKGIDAVRHAAMKPHEGK